MDKPHDWRAHALPQVLWLLDPRGSLAKRWLARVYIHPDTKLGPPDTQVRQAGRPVHHVDRCERLWLRIWTATLQGLTAGPVIHLPTDGRQCRRGVRHPAICGYGLRDRRADRHPGRHPCRMASRSTTRQGRSRGPRQRSILPVRPTSSTRTAAAHHTQSQSNSRSGHRRLFMPDTAIGGITSTYQPTMAGDTRCTSTTQAGTCTTTASTKHPRRGQQTG